MSAQNVTSALRPIGLYEYSADTMSLIQLHQKNGDVLNLLSIVKNLNKDRFSLEQQKKSKIVERCIAQNNSFMEATVNALVALGPETIDQIIIHFSKFDAPLNDTGSIPIFDLEDILKILKRFEPQILISKFNKALKEIPSELQIFIYQWSIELQLIDQSEPIKTKLIEYLLSSRSDIFFFLTLRNALNKNASDDKNFSTLAKKYIQKCSDEQDLDCLIQILLELLSKKYKYDSFSKTQLNELQEIIKAHGSQLIELLLETIITNDKHLQAFFHNKYFFENLVNTLNHTHIEDLEQGLFSLYHEAIPKKLEVFFKIVPLLNVNDRTKIVKALVDYSLNEQFGDTAYEALKKLNPPGELLLTILKQKATAKEE